MAHKALIREHHLVSCPFLPLYGYIRKCGPADQGVPKALRTSCRQSYKKVSVTSKPVPHTNKSDGTQASEATKSLAATYVGQPKLMIHLPMCASCTSASSD
eukprot:943070-Amphidinium_carterae.1